MNLWTSSFSTDCVMSLSCVIIQYLLHVWHLYLVYVSVRNQLMCVIGLSFIIFSFSYFWGFGLLGFRPFRQLTGVLTPLLSKTGAPLGIRYNASNFTLIDYICISSLFCSFLLIWMNLPVK